MKRSTVDLGVGVFVLLGMAALGWLSINLGRVDFLGASGYVLVAEFPSVGGLKVGSTVEIAGVQVGRVERITLAEYQARVAMTIRRDVKIQDDAIASIKTRGLIGEKYIQITPGGSDAVLPPDGRIREVEPPVDLEEILSKYVFGKV
jgi:phospholipid/cholesterol/gamma-HCH transport system substrate-binding protein